MLVHGDYLYILCGTSSWIYNSNVFEIHLPTMKGEQIGFTFQEIEDAHESGR
jgi:hypothetical protein